MLLRDRLFIAYLEAADVLEVISYNETDGRFEFQVVHDYRPGGQPQVRYARRAVCIACHQNAAPIFARPLWDETNANASVAATLEGMGIDYHGVPARVGVDIAYAIDNATDRANELALTQMLWRDGCGDAERGARCRAALFTLALQSALSGERGFDQTSEAYRQSLRTPMQDIRARRWPAGLLLSDPDIPNRKPLDGFRLDGGVTRSFTHSGLRQRADVEARFEPLAARAPAARWDPDPDAWVARAVRGLRQFLSAEDLRRIDTLLYEGSAEHSTHTAECRVDSARHAAATRIRLDCRGNAFAMRGALQIADAGRAVSGRLRELQVQGAELGSLEVIGRVADDRHWQLTPRRTGTRLGVRLPSGDALDSLVVRSGERSPGEATAELRVRHDFGRVAAAIRQIETGADSGFGQQSFSRAGLLPRLLTALGRPTEGWCCNDQQGFPEPRAERLEMPGDEPLLAPFLQACAACHRSSEPFPPNFLAGSADSALEGIAHCAERIQFRLAMWDLDSAHRPKTPMPPRYAGGLSEAELAAWTGEALPRLRSALDTITARGAQTLPARELTRSRPYSELRPCLPSSRGASG